MKSSDLAIRGGEPYVTAPWPDASTIGEEEKQAVLRVLDSGVLSGFRAEPGPGFLGGPTIRRLEKDWARFFGVRHAISFNSLTSGLQAAMGAIGIGPGDEVIVSPFTMAASATCPLWYGGIPVFADIDLKTYCLDPKSVERRITPKTKAIIVVHLFGHPAEMDDIISLARKHNLMVIEDCAQAPAAMYRGSHVGTIGHIGGFSLNQHKAIHSGEGGVMVTDDNEIALRLQLIRNHGEVAVEGRGVKRLPNTFGGNYRMTEMEAAIATAQLKKLEWLTEARIKLADYLNEKLSGLLGLTPQRLSHAEDRHVYYMYPIRYDQKVCGIPRKTFVRAVCAEGIPMRFRYVRPLYLEPLFRKRIAFNKGQFPFISEFSDGTTSYEPGLCPVAEVVHGQELVFGNLCRWPLSTTHMDQVVGAFQKVLDHRRELCAEERIL